MTSASFCVHGHFYQPAREDPLTGEIPLEPGAFPFQNWNERIHAHCYRPNAELGNFERISFNIGPTLFEWMAVNYPDTCELIVAQEKRNFERYGVGNGMAQAYHHTILPLASRMEKMTEVRWGIADFQNRFGHVPKGLWLPETAADLETLDILAQCGIEFTILAPWQAADDTVDITQPYWVDLPGGNRIVVFFYQPELSARISFDPSSTTNATTFFREILMPQFHGHGSRDRERIVMMASDGELYGHHQQFRDQFLSHLTQMSVGTDAPQPTYPARWLLNQQPARSIRIRKRPPGVAIMVSPAGWDTVDVRRTGNGKPTCGRHLTLWQMPWMPCTWRRCSAGRMIPGRCVTSTLCDPGEAQTGGFVGGFGGNGWMNCNCARLTCCLVHSMNASACSPPVDGF